MPPSSITFVQFSRTFKSCREVDRPPINPNCLLLNRPNLSIWSTIPFRMSFSISVHKMLVRLTGRWFEADFLSPFFNKAVIVAILHPSGTTLVTNELLKIIHSGLSTILANSNCSLGCTLSGPGGFVVLRLNSSFRISPVVNSSSQECYEYSTLA